LSAGALILLLVVASVAIVTNVTLYIFRLVLGSSGTRELVNEGAVLAETGIEFPRFLFCGKWKVSYYEIAGAELVPFPKSLGLRLGYPSAISFPGGSWDFRRPTVVLKFKSRPLFPYRLVAPSDPERFVERLNSYISALARR
jgi:hypothetical protein